MLRPSGSAPITRELEAKLAEERRRNRRHRAVGAIDRDAARAPSRPGSGSTVRA